MEQKMAENYIFRLGLGFYRNAIVFIWNVRPNTPKLLNSIDLVP